MDEAALKAMFEKENVDAVIHCAALKAVGESVQKPLEYYRNNITGTLTLMDVMKQTSVKNIDKLKVLIMYEVIRFMNYLFFYSNLIYLWKVKYHYFMHISSTDQYRWAVHCLDSLDRSIRVRSLGIVFSISI